MNHTAQITWIIDDDEVYKYGFCKYIELKELCAKVVDFSNGREAINFLNDVPDVHDLPDIIFLDIDMPVMNGWEFMEAFESIKQRIEKEIKIFLLTSSISYEDILRAKNQPGITDYIIKPINSQQFTSAFTVSPKKTV